MKTVFGLFFAVCVLLNGALAQAQANIAGTLYASNFARWTVKPGDRGSFSWSNPGACTVTSGGVSFIAFRVGTPVTILDTDPTLTETVTPLQVNIGVSGCSFSAVTAHAHNSFVLISGTYGVQDAINYASGQPYIVLVTPDFAHAGGTTGTITAAKGSSLISILDERTSQLVTYLWDGSSYIASSTGGGSPTGPAGGDLGGTYPNPTVTTSHITSGAAGFTGPVTITSAATSGNVLFINTNSLFGSAVSPVVLQGNAASGPAFGFTNTSYGANNKTWDIYQNPTSLNFRTSDDANSSNVTWLSAVRSGNSITGLTSNSGSGAWAHTGSFSATGNVNVQGNISSASNTNPASPTNSGVALNATPNIADVQMFDATRTVNNRTAEWIFWSGAAALRFANDAHSAVVTPFQVTGGQATGITGITSDSGSGTWTHTGAFSATSFTGSGAGLTNLNASAISSGTVPSARLPLATTSAFGAVECDGTTISCTAGVIAAVAGGSGTVTHTAGALTLNQIMLGNGSGDSKVDTVAATDGAGNLTAASYATNGTAPGSVLLTAGTGNIATLTANSFGFAAPVTGGTSYLVKPPATMTAGIAHFATPATVDGVNESALTSSAVALTADVSGILPIANGGTATATPALVGGTNVTITGSWPNQTINATSGGSGTVTSSTINQVARYTAATTVTGSPVMTDDGLGLLGYGTAATTTLTKFTLGNSANTNGTQLDVECNTSGGAPFLIHNQFGNAIVVDCQGNINNGGKITNLAGAQSAGQYGVPVVQGVYKSGTQTGSIAAQTLVASGSIPSTTSLYTSQCGLKVISSTVGVLTITYTWSDSTGARTFTPISGVTLVAGAAYQNVPDTTFEATNTANITVATTLVSGAASYSINCATTTYNQ